MNLTIAIADTSVKITFPGQAERAVPLCRDYFRGFLRPGEIADAEIEISILKNANDHPPIQRESGNVHFEKRLNSRDVFSWLSQFPEYERDFPEHETTIASSCLDSLLLFDPHTAAGRIYLLKWGPECFRPLHRLLWMYLAQVLGEKRSCFIHCAALVQDGKGYLFLGDSGAGKSSLAKVSDQAIVLSDDSPVLSKQNGDYVVFSSPFHQMNPLMGWNKEVIGLSAIVEGLYFLAKDDRLYLHGISRKKAVSMILKRYILFFPYISARAKSALFDLILKLCHRFPIYNLHFCLEQDVWGLIAGPGVGGSDEEFRKRG